MFPEFHTDPGALSLGNRMKAYEASETFRRFDPDMPLYARIDGRGFSRFTKGMSRPFDQRLTSAMIATTADLVAQTHACIGYIQSDEISLAWRACQEGASRFFDGKIMKMSSVLASMAAANLLWHLKTSFGDEADTYLARRPHFDARVIAMPSDTEVSNMLLWRTMDAKRNAVSMAAHHHFSHKSLQGQSERVMRARLEEEANIRMEDYPEAFTQGTFVRRQTISRVLDQSELDRIPETHRPSSDAPVTRTVVSSVSWPSFWTVKNRTEAIFQSEAPVF